MDYQEFINSKGNKFIESGFEIYDRNLNKNLLSDIITVKER